MNAIFGNEIKRDLKFFGEKFRRKKKYHKKKNLEKKLRLFVRGSRRTTLF